MNEFTKKLLTCDVWNTLQTGTLHVKSEATRMHFYKELLSAPKFSWGSGQQPYFDIGSLCLRSQVVQIHMPKTEVYT